MGVGLKFKWELILNQRFTTINMILTYEKQLWELKTLNVDGHWPVDMLYT